MLVKLGYDRDISNKETIFESKTGRYVLEVEYTNEQDYTYNYEIIGGHVLTIVYDQHQVEVTAPGQHELK